MNGFTLENQTANSYLTYEMRPDEREDKTVLGMLTNQDIPGVAKTSFMRMDLDRYLRFDVTGRIRLREYLERCSEVSGVEKKKLLKMLSCITEAYNACPEDYMIPTNNLLLDQDHVYVNVADGDAVVICMPLDMSHVPAPDLRAFVQEIVTGTKHYAEDGSENYLARIINMANSINTFSGPAFAELLKTLSTDSGRVGTGGVRPGTSGVGAGSQIGGQFGGGQFGGSQQSSGNGQFGGQQNMSGGISFGNGGSQQGGGISFGNGGSQQGGGISFGNGGSQQGDGISFGNGSSQQGGGISFGNGGAASGGQSGAGGRGNIGGINIPGQKKETGTGSGSSDEKPMSLFYLLQHYNSKNAKIYKEQKAAAAAEKEATKGNKPEKAKKEKPAKENKKTKTGAAPIGGMNFRIPGQEASGPAAYNQNNVAGEQRTPVNHFSFGGGNNQAEAAGAGGGMQQGGGMGRQQVPMGGLQTKPVGGASGGYKSLEEGPTEVFGDLDDSGTMLLDDMPANARLGIPYLIRRKNQERIPINVALFRIGRDKDFNHYYIPENRYIGHAHCHLLTKGNTVYVIDDQSKNHTFVDGVMINPGEEVMLTDGCVLKLGDEEFDFRFM